MSNNPNIYIAVVDDDERMCRSFSRFLLASHYQPIAYSSAESFLADEKHPKFDCLVLDIHLGGMSGLELSQKLSEAQDRTPVIFITAHDDPKIREQAKAAGCAAFFLKTDPGADVLLAIRQAVDEVAQRR